MGDSSGVSGKIDEAGAVELTGKIMVVAIIVLAMVIIFVFFLHLYAKWFWYRRQGDNGNAPSTTRRRRRFEFAPGYQEVTAVSALRRGLDPSVLKSLPIVAFDSKAFKDGLECAVCLSEVSEGEKTRILPKCNHGFHVECIDMWFQSHSTCPLCRNPVSDQSCQQPTAPESRLENMLRGPTEESPTFPTNVLFWGDETQVNTLGPCLEESAHQAHPSSQPMSSSTVIAAASTSSRPGELAIDIPGPVIEEEDQKSQIPTRLRSLKRLLSRDRRVSPRSPCGTDIEEASRAQS